MSGGQIPRVYMIFPALGGGKLDVCPIKKKYAKRMMEIRNQLTLRESTPQYLYMQFFIL